eukprot:scaffold5663_cov96-Skeletonema_dohrnii-CCMP3373.AAC.3
MNKIVELNWTGEDSTLDEYASILLCARPARMRNPNRETCVVFRGALKWRATAFVASVHREFGNTFGTEPGIREESLIRDGVHPRQNSANRSKPSSLLDDSEITVAEDLLCLFPGLSG